jgi:hypothetical protein
VCIVTWDGSQLLDADGYRVLESDGSRDICGDCCGECAKLAGAINTLVDVSGGFPGGPASSCTFPNATNIDLATCTDCATGPTCFLSGQAGPGSYSHVEVGWDGTQWYISAVWIYGSDPGYYLANAPIMFDGGGKITGTYIVPCVAIYGCTTESLTLVFHA